MERFRSKLMPIFLVLYLILLLNQINCQCGGDSSTVLAENKIESMKKDDNYLIVKNIFDKESKIKTGDVMECNVTKSIESSNNDIHVFTQKQPHHGGMIFFPTSKNKKCLSFQVRTEKYPHIMLGTPPMVSSGPRIEAILEFEGKSVFRTLDGKFVSTTQIKGLVNDKELRGFWIRWLDDQLFEFGRNTDSSPILSYKLPEKLTVNYVGLLSYTADAEWILHADPKCGQYNITEKAETETKCKILSNLKLEKTIILQKSQEHILNQIKLQHEIFKLSKYKSKEILLEYQQLAKKHFKKAEENQNQIYAADNEIYCPQKATTFIQITKEYFQFLEELQVELSIYTDNDNKTLINHCSNYCCGCNTIHSII